MLKNDFASNEQPWQEWRKYALDPKYQGNAEGLLRLGSSQFEKGSALQPSQFSPKSECPSTERNKGLFEQGLMKTIDHIPQNRMAPFDVEYRNSILDVSALEPYKLDEKSSESAQELAISVQREQFRAEIEILRSNLFSGLQREEELKAYLDDCYKVPDHSLAKLD